MTRSSWWRTSSATSRAGMTPKEAAHRTMDEVGGALVSIALTLCAVFVPSAFLSGISGQFFRQFAVTIAASTVISLLCLADAQPGAVRAAAQAARSAARGRQGHWPDAALRAAFGVLQSRVRMAFGRLWRADAAPGARAGGRGGGLCRADRCRRRAIRPHADRVHSRAGPGLPHHRAATSAGRQPGADRAGGEAGDRHHPEDAGRRACRAVRRPGRDDVHRRVQFGDDLFRPAVAV